MQTDQTLQSKLGPLMEPGPVAFSFSTTGWYVLAGLLLFFLSFLAYRALKNYRAQAYRRQALAQLEALPASKSDANPRAALAELTLLLALLKIVATQRYGRPKVASLSGMEWWRFLESTGKETPFGQYADKISTALFSEEGLDDQTLKTLQRLTKTWIKTHA